MCHPFSSSNEEQHQVNWSRFQNVLHVCSSFYAQGGKSVYDSFAPGRKEQSQSAHEALLRAKLLSNEHSECKQDCTEGTDFLLPIVNCLHINWFYVVLLKLAEGCSESDTHLMLGYLLAISKV